MRKGFVSIIIPNYNCEMYLPRCLESVNRQSYDKIEIIIVDDGSSDESVHIINNLKKTCKYEVHTIFQFNQNGAIARNRGIEVSSGEYLYFLDSDDELYDSNIISKMVSSICENDLLLTDYEIVDKNNSMVGDYFVNNNLLSYPNVYKYSRISPVPSNKFFKSSIVKDNGVFFSNVRIGQDLNFYLKYLSLCERVIVCDFKAYKYRILESSVTRKCNFNFLDIYNCFNDIRKFYYDNNNENNYNNYIVNVAMEHYHQQFSKIINFKGRKIKKFIYYFFSYCFDECRKLSLNKDNYFKKNNNSFLLKIFLYKFGIFSFVKKIKRGIDTK